MRYLYFVLLSVLVLSVACENIDMNKLSDADLERISDNVIVCDPPYIRHASSCCLDTNDNSICDDDETPQKVVFNNNDNVPYIDSGDKIIINSGDWRDVYSGMLYVSLINKQPGIFLTSKSHVPIIFYSIEKNVSGLTILSSKLSSYSDVEEYAKENGYNNIKNYDLFNFNLGLAESLVKNYGINKFIIVSESQNYNAISVASYAIADEYYVLLTNEQNKEEIISFLKSSNPEKIIFLGIIDNSYSQELNGYNIENILGDKYTINIELVKRYRQIKNSNQFLLTSGTFIESSIMSGTDPVILIEEPVPQVVYDYIKNSDLQLGILVGNDLIDAATAIRRQLGISIFVKFAQGARNTDGQIASVEDLDKFPLP